MEKLLTGVSQRIGMSYDGAGMGIACSDSQSGSLTMNTGGMVSMDNEKIALSLDIRYPVSADGEQLLKQLQQAAQTAA